MACFRQFGGASSFQKAKAKSRGSRTGSKDAEPAQKADAEPTQYSDKYIKKLEQKVKLQAAAAQESKHDPINSLKTVLLLLLAIVVLEILTNF